MCFAPPCRSLRVLRRPARRLLAAPEQGAAPPDPWERACPLPAAVAAAPLTDISPAEKANFFASCAFFIAKPRFFRAQAAISGPFLRLQEGDWGYGGATPHVRPKWPVGRLLFFRIPSPDFCLIFEHLGANAVLTPFLRLVLVVMHKVAHRDKHVTNCTVMAVFM
jgi:hypothetical protein